METVTSQVLYTMDSQGKTRCWRGIVTPQSDGTAIIENESGLVGGVLSSIPIHVKVGKNIGRKNETTPFEQAVKRMRSAFDKKLKEGYVLDLADFEESGVMKAHNARDSLHKLPEYVYAQHKLDGIRAKFTGKATGNELTSKSNRLHPEFLKELPCIAALDHMIEEGQSVDGEFYIHGMPLPEITSLVRSYKLCTAEFLRLCTPVDNGFLVNIKMADLKDLLFVGLYDTDMILERAVKVKEGIYVEADLECIELVGSQDLEFWIFDAPDPDMTFEERFLTLNDYRGMSDHHIVVVHTEMIHKDELDAFNEFAISQGFEGTMLRNPAGKYVFGRKSYDLQKYKNFYDSEFPITGFSIDNQGNPNLKFLSDAGYEFEARPIGSAGFRRRLLRDMDTLIGRQATIRYQTLHKGTLVPQFGRVIEIRDYE